MQYFGSADKSANLFGSASKSASPNYGLTTANISGEIPQFMSYLSQLIFDWDQSHLPVLDMDEI